MGKLLVGFGIIILIFSAIFFWERYAPQRLSFNINNYPDNNVANSASKPIEVIISAINMDLPIIPAKLVRGNWEATTKGVSYLSSSPIPGTTGNSILYGHDWPNLLGNILKLKPGQIIKIKYLDGESKEFIINSTALVSPNEISILAPSKDARITLYTCTGLFDNKRFVVVAILQTHIYITFAPLRYNLISFASIDRRTVGNHS
jgi:LPXTG-site transpeptidase (sortase) family protein